MRRARVILFSLALVGAFVLGRVSQHEAYAGSSPVSPYKKLSLFGKVLAYIENNYVEEVTEEQLIYGAIKGMLSSLDPHTTFYPPELYRELRGDNSGEFVGVGVEVNLEANGEFVVISTMEGAPAQRAGVKSGDVISLIEKKPTKGWESTDIIKALRGKPGTKVDLTVRRQGATEELSFELTREQITLVPVSYELLPSKLGYIKIKFFQEKTAKQFEEALSKLEVQSGFKGLILDLRDNPGGLVEQAVQVADALISDGVIVSTEGKSAKNVETFYAHPKKTHEGFPVVVLVNAGSASSSEIVAGALQDHRRAVIMGSTTFGKGSVQSIIEFDDGSALKLTIARYFTPAHRSIQERGITPDLWVDDSAPLPVEKKVSRESALPGHLKNGSPPVAAPTFAKPDDYPLSRAVEYLTAWQTLSNGTEKRPVER
jgi:carboxyl-terminal processing protease